MQRFGTVFGIRGNLLLSAAGLAAVALPIVFGLASATPSRAQSQAPNAPANAPVYEYEVASIKPAKPGTEGRIMMGLSMPADGINGTNVTMMTLIQQAFGVQPYQISGAPDWFTSEHFDLNAKMDPAVADALQKLSPDDRRIARQQMLQALLADRLKLTIRRDTKELPVYSLVIAKNGSKLKESKPDNTASNTANGATTPTGVGGPPRTPVIVGVGGGETGTVTSRGGMIFRTGSGPGGGMHNMSATAAPIGTLVRMLSARLGRPVLDKTGLTGKYDFKLQFAPEPDQGQAFGVGDGGGVPPAPVESSGPSIFTAVQEQLGLKLESGKGPVEIIVIDHVERPTGN